MRNRFLLLLLVLPLAGCVTSSLSFKTQYALFKDVPYADYGGGVKLVADIYDPDAANAPIVILVHGGGWNSRAGDMQAIGSDLAKQGFLVYAVTYRFAPQFVYPAQLEDLKNALRFIEADAPARQGDLKNIFVWGYSSGGHLAFMLGLDPENKIKGIVTGAAPVDLTEYPKSPTITKFLGKTYAKRRNTGPKFHR
jgi:acetyl esterase/lipase